MGGVKLVTSKNGATGSVVARVDLIPYNALIRLAARFEHGAEKHGVDNWRKGLDDKTYVIHRATHIALHALKLISKLQGHLPEDGDD